MLLNLPHLHAQMGFADNTTGEMTKFTIPERDQEGRLLWLLEGNRARFRPDGTKEIEGLKVTTFHKTKPDWIMATPQCIFNQTIKQAVGEKEVRIYNDKVHITGMGFHWLVNDSRFIIRSNATVIISGGLTREKVL